MKESRPETFRFKKFELSDTRSAMKIGTDGVILGAWAFENTYPNRILDVGAGTGLISLMMAQRFPSAEVTGIEIDADAAEEARENISRSPWHDRISVIPGDFATCVLKPVDAIVSNPPFFTTGLTAADTQRAGARHEGSLTLGSLVNKSADILVRHGTLALILPYERLDETIYICALRHLDVSRIARIASRPGTVPIRVMLEFTMGLTQTYTQETIYIRTHDNLYSQRYGALTRNFYL